MEEPGVTPFVTGTSLTVERFCGDICTPKCQDSCTLVRNPSFHYYEANDPDINVIKYDIQYNLVVIHVYEKSNALICLYSIIFTDT